MSRLEPNTLKYYVDPEKQLESESDKSSEGSSGDDSDTSTVQEDESSDSVNILWYLNKKNIHIYTLLL